MISILNKSFLLRVQKVPFLTRVLAFRINGKSRFHIDARAHLRLRHRACRFWKTCRMLRPTNESVLPLSFHTKNKFSVSDTSHQPIYAGKNSPSTIQSNTRSRKTKTQFFYSYFLTSHFCLYFSSYCRYLFVWARRLSVSSQFRFWINRKISSKSTKTSVKYDLEKNTYFSSLSNKQAYASAILLYDGSDFNLELKESGFNDKR